jgi:hypothetical protein
MGMSYNKKSIDAIGSRTMNKQLFAVPFWTTLIALGGTPAFAGAGAPILSDTNTGLVVNAYPAANGTYLRLSKDCSTSIIACTTWHWVNGMIVSNTIPSLAVNAYGGAVNGTYLRLVNNCSASNPDCTWHYNKGMIVSDTNPWLAVNAYGGAANGTNLRLVDNCSASNTDCTWSWGVLTK